MPDPRPRPSRLDLTPRKNRPPRKPKATKRPRKTGGSRGPKDDSYLAYWIAGGLLAALAIVVVLYFETPEIAGWWAKREKQAEQAPASAAEGRAVDNSMPLPSGAPEGAPAPAPVAPPKPVVPAQPTAEELRLKREKELKEKTALELKEKAALEMKHEAERPGPAVVQAPPVGPLPPTASSSSPGPGLPPVVQPVPQGVPARALPLDPNVLTTERIAAYQVALERIHFSCGFVDGDQGMRTQRMLRAFQQSRGLPVTGFLDQATRDAIGEPGEPFQNYTVTADDVDSIMPKPETWMAKSKAKRLGYNDIWELLAEKFHCTRSYLKALNPGVTRPEAGTDIIGPKVHPAAPIPKASSLRISLSDTSIEALDANGRIIAFFPCSIAKDKAKRPHGLLTVKVVDPNPDYTFDPALFADAAKAEGITHKMTLPPGPRNPVGTTWVGLSLPGYGIHGTPEPENISRTQSHGCFRLANWNAEKVLKMVRVGTPVDVVP